MAKRSEESTMVAAAIAFDAQLAEYARLAELLLKTPLATMRQVERANQTIEEIAATETRLGEAGRDLVQAITASRDRQQQLAADIVAHLPAVQQRNQDLREILEALQQLGESMRTINATATGGASLLEVEEQVNALAVQADELAARARAASFDEPASQAHALHQQMLAVVRKLRTVTSRQS